MFQVVEKKKINIPLRVTKTPNNFSYSIENGEQENTYLSERNGVSTRLLGSSTSTTNRDFFGHCYNCGCMRHSQNYCPLKLCSICAKFGHDQRVCFFNPCRKIWSSSSEKQQTDESRTEVSRGPVSTSHSAGVN